MLMKFPVLMPLIMLLGVGLIFLPFGFSQFALLEEWGFLAIFAEEGPLYFLTKHTPVASHRMRPLTFFLPSLAFQLDPDSFLYWNIFQFIVIWLKGIAMGAIVWWLYPKRWIAILGGLIFMIYPADTQQLSLRILSINSSVAFVLCAVAILLWATHIRTILERAVVACCAGILFLIACLTYEAALFLAPIPLLLWWAKYGFRDGWQNFRIQGIVVFFWLVAIGLELGYLFWVGGDSDIYQNGVSNNPMNTWKIMLQNSPMLLTVGFYRTFFHGWYDAMRMLFSAGDWIIYLPALVLFILLLFVGLGAKKSYCDAYLRLEPHFIKRWLFVSILIALLGYLPYLPSNSHILITQRTYLFAGIGGALMFTALVAILRERLRLLGAGVGGCLLLFGMSAQWTQFAHYNAITDKHKMILSGILEVAPRLSPDEKLLIIDRTGCLGNLWMLKGELLGSALTVLYGVKTEIVVCLEPGHLWGSFSTDALGRMGKCVVQHDSLLVGQGTPAYFFLPKTSLVTVVIDSDGHIHRDIPNPLQPPATPYEQARWGKLLGCWPAKNCRDKSQKGTLPDYFIFNFGEWWSMEDPIPGAGWQDTQWTPPAWQPRSCSWMNQSKSTLIFHIASKPIPYIFELGLLNSVSDVAKHSLNVLLNGHLLEHHWKDSMNAQAEVDPTWLKEGANELLFVTDIDPVHGVSLAVEYVRVVPKVGAKAYEAMVPG